MTLVTRLRKSGNFLLWFLPLLVILGLIPALVAQGPADDPSDNDNTPIKSGYAIVTPSLVGGLATDSPKGLVVFETFGQHRGQDAAQAGVLPANLSTDFLLFVSTSGRLSRNLGVAVANPGTLLAQLTFTLLDKDGKSPFSPEVINLASGQQTSLFVTEIFKTHPLPQDFIGTLLISSNTPVAVIGLRFRGLNFSTLPATTIGLTYKLPSSAGGKIGGDFAAILPQFATGGGWASEIILINSSKNDLLVRVDLFDKEGKALTAVLNGVSASTFDKIPVPAGGVVVLSQRDANGDSEF